MKQYRVMGKFDITIECENGARALTEGELALYHLVSPLLKPNFTATSAFEEEEVLP